MSELDTAAPVEDPAPPPVAEEEAAVEQPAQEAAAPDDADAAFDADVKTHGVQLPEGEILVPLSSVTSLREKLKAAKAGSADVATLKQQLDAAHAQLQQVAPLAEAFKAMQQAQQVQQPQQVAQQPAAAAAEDTSELEEIAKDFDFYKADGTADLDKARRVQARTTKQAEAISQRQVAPLVQNTLQERAIHNVSRAKATLHPVTKQAADPKIIDGLVAQIARQPNGLATLADAEAMKQIWLVASSLSSFTPAAAAVDPPAAPAKETPTPPVFTERAGGKVPAQRGLSAAEKRAAKDSGMSEAEYLKAAADMPWGV